MDPSILFIGDIVGNAGRRTMKVLLPGLREEFNPTFIIANGENAAGGLGITPAVADELFALGVDAITLGNHAYHQRAVYEYLDRCERIVRPANYLRSQPGRRWCVIENDGIRLGVTNISGNAFLQASHPMFAEIEEVLAQFERQRVDHILVDVHAEATSEKVAFGWHLDGRVTAIVGTHTHVPTADARVLPKGTAYISDVGMTGARDGVIGFRRDQAIQRFVSGMPIRLEPSNQNPWLMGVVISCQQQRLQAQKIEPVLRAVVS